MYLEIFACVTCRRGVLLDILETYIKSHGAS